MIYTKRSRDADKSLVQLDLTDADAADRRIEFSASDLHSGKRLMSMGFKASTAQPRDIQVYRVDAVNANVLHLLYERLGDTSTSWKWAPDEEEAAGMDFDAPNDRSGSGYRLQLSQTAGACLVDPYIDVKAV